MILCKVSYVFFYFVVSLFFFIVFFDLDFLFLGKCFFVVLFGIYEYEVIFFNCLIEKIFFVFIFVLVCFNVFVVMILIEML